MSARERNSRRNTKIPNKLLDTYYDGTKVKKNDSKARGSKIGVTQSNRNNDTCDARVCTENVAVGDTMENLGCLEMNTSGTNGNEGCLDTADFPTLNESVRMKGINREDTVDKQRDSGDDKGIQQVCEQHDHQAPNCNVSQSSTSVNVQSNETVKTNVDGSTNDVSDKPVPESETNKCNVNEKSNHNDKQSNVGSESAKQNKNTKKTYAKATASNTVKYDNKLSHIPTEVDNEVGVSRGGYARVFVEIQANKELPTKIDVLYKNSLNEVLGTKIVQVAYCWKPPCCKGCGVFGHNDETCPKNVDSNGNKDLRNEVEAEREVENREDKKQNGKNNGNNKVQNGNNNDKGYFGNKGNSRKNDKGFFRPKQNSNTKADNNEEVKSDGSNNRKMNNDGDEGNKEIRSNKQKENAKEKNVNKRNSNKFEVLGNLDDETREILDMEARARWDELVINNKIDCKNNQGCSNEMEDVCADKSGFASLPPIFAVFRLIEALYYLSKQLFNILLIYATEVTARLGQFMMEDLVAMHMEFKQFYGPQETNFLKMFNWEELEALPPALKR
ncbi:Beta-Casp domain-containing protein [Artemisia annua]|uniref:Beta-Casp domain-containing protein n=1 Tax=Artemisia annua TaxID=35608 RepID=A0A2U1NEU1_ARTAN|nr:Beta-Casp domain-containing protein [Artemisia annua]